MTGTDPERTRGMARPARRFPAARRLLPLLLLLPLPWTAGLPARAETVAVADCERDSAVDYWAAADVQFCRRVMDEVFALAGVEPVRAEFDADGMLVVSNAEVVCSAFRTPKLLEDYDFPQQPMGRMHYGVYMTQQQASKLFGAKVPLVGITADVEIENTHSVKRFAKILPKPVTTHRLQSLFRDLAG